LYDIKYIKRSLPCDPFSCKILIGYDSSYSEWLIITEVHTGNDYIFLYYNKMSPTRRLIESSYIKDVQDVSKLHHQFFLLLIRNADAITNKDNESRFGLHKELFFKYILPNMQEVQL